MMDELRRTKERVSPSDTLLVVDAMTGQEAAGLVKTFNDQVDLTGEGRGAHWGAECTEWTLMRPRMRCRRPGASITRPLLPACDGREATVPTQHITTATPHPPPPPPKGAILTKLDGDSRGGAALSVREVSGAPIKFVGTGETMEALEPFYPERMANRILGMGDMITLYEKAQEAIKVGHAGGCQGRSACSVAGHACGGRDHLPPVVSAWQAFAVCWIPQ